MNAIVIFLAMSLDIAGVGGLLSGIFVHSFRRAMIWAVGFGSLSVIIGWLVHFAPNFVFLLIAVFWCLVGWSVKYLARRVAVKVAVRGSSKG